MNTALFLLLVASIAFVATQIEWRNRPTETNNDGARSKPSSHTKPNEAAERIHQGITELPSKEDMDDVTHIILVGGGSFSPPTIMHMRMFDLARDHLHRHTKYRILQGIISPVSDHYNKSSLVSADHRLAMVAIAVRELGWIKPDPWESRQMEYVTTLALLKHAKSMTRNRVMFMCGTDLVETLDNRDSWDRNEVEQILRDFGLVVHARPGYQNPENVIKQSALLTQYKHNIVIIPEWATVQISSTHIRGALKRGETIRFFMQQGVLDYIYKHKLFGAGGKAGQHRQLNGSIAEEPEGESLQSRAFIGERKGTFFGVGDY